jgi:hypothetical protein
MEILRDYYSLETGLTVMEGADGRSTLKLKGIISEAEKLNKNNRIYPKKILEKEVKRLQKLIESNGPISGELDHPATMTVSLKNASHGLTKVWMEGNKVLGEFMIYETPNCPAGKLAADLIKLGVKIGVSSRATGNLIPLGESKTEVGDQLRIKCWDLVADPSFESAVPGISESVNDVSIEATFKEYQKETQLINVLNYIFNRNTKK